MKHGKRILSVTVRKIYDESPDTSYLGEYSRRPNSEFSIDRALDQFTGNIERARQLLLDAEEFVSEIWDDFISDDNPEHTTDHPEARALDEAIDILRGTRKSNFDAEWHRYEYRYFNPSFNYITKNGTPTDGLTPEDVRKYTRRDYERMERLNYNDWCYIGIRAECEIELLIQHANLKQPYYQTQTIYSSGLWGIESDSDDSYFEDIKQDELRELRNQLVLLGFSKRAISKAFKTVEDKEF